MKQDFHLSDRPPQRCMSRNDLPFTASGYDAADACKDKDRNDTQDKDIEYIAESPARQLRSCKIDCWQKKTAPNRLFPEVKGFPKDSAAANNFTQTSPASV